MLKTQALMQNKVKWLAKVTRLLCSESQGSPVPGRRAAALYGTFLSY